MHFIVSHEGSSSLYTIDIFEISELVQVCKTRDYFVGTIDAKQHRQRRHECAITQNKNVLYMLTYTGEKKIATRTRAAGKELVSIHGNT